MRSGLNLSKGFELPNIFIAQPPWNEMKWIVKGLPNSIDYQEIEATTDFFRSNPELQERDLTI